MKVAVISDIHANLCALNSVLEDIKLFNPDKIFCLGDLILGGYNPNGVLKVIFKLKEKYGDDFQIIQGNTDNMVANCNPQLLEKTKEFYPCMGYSLEEDVKITKPEYIEFVKYLPENKIINLNNLSVHLVHGSPRNQNENIAPGLLIDEVEQMVSNSSAELILCGHTHKPCGYALESSKTVINVGSVGRPLCEDKRACYLQLTIDSNGQFFTEHKFIEYDRKMVSNHILSRGLKFGEELAKMIYEE